MRPVVCLFLPFAFPPRLCWWTIQTRGRLSLVGRPITRLASHGPFGPSMLAWPLLLPLPSYVLPPIHFRLHFFAPSPRSAACCSSLLVRSFACSLRRLLRRSSFACGVFLRWSSSSLFHAVEVPSVAIRTAARLFSSAHLWFGYVLICSVFCRACSRYGFLRSSICYSFLLGWVHPSCLIKCLLESYYFVCLQTLLLL